MIDSINSHQFTSAAEVFMLEEAGRCLQVSFAHVLRSYEATLPQHKIPLAGDTYFYRILLRLSLNSSTRNWRVRLISECRRARHTYGGGSQGLRRDHCDACAAFASALDEGRAGQKRRQQSVLRSTRAHPKRARSLSGGPAPLQPHCSRGRSFSPSAGRQSLVTFHDSGAHQLGSDLRPERSGRIVCEGVGCSRSREQSPERAAIYDALRERDLQGEQSSEFGIHWQATGLQSREQSPQREAVERAVRTSGGPSQRDDQRRPASAHKEVQVGEVTERAAALGRDESSDVFQTTQQAPRPAEHDANRAHPHRCSCQQCLASEPGWVASGNGGNRPASYPDSLSDTAFADLTCPGCGEFFEPPQAGMHSGVRQLRPSSAAGVGGEAHARGDVSAWRLHCRLCRLPDRSPRWQGTDASTCEHCCLTCVKTDCFSPLQPETCCAWTRRQVKGLDRTCGQGKVTVLQHDESQTEDSTELQQGGGRESSVAPRPAASTQVHPAQPLIVHSSDPDPDAEAKRERAVTALSAATKQRAFDAWLDLRTRRQGLLAAAASLWTVGTLRGTWALWQAEHRRTASQLEWADRHAGVVVSRRAMQVRGQRTGSKQAETETAHRH